MGLASLQIENSNNVDVLLDSGLNLFVSQGLLGLWRSITDQGFVVKNCYFSQLTDWSIAQFLSFKYHTKLKYPITDVAIEQ